MILTLLIGIIIAVCLVSTLIVYVFIRSKENVKSPFNETRQIKYSLTPTIDIITKKVHKDFSFHSSISSDKSNRSSTTLNPSEDNSLNSKKQHKSFESINRLVTPIRSSSVVNSSFQVQHRPRSPNWRQGSIVDPNHLALIQFTLPSNVNDKYRRRSVAVCNNTIERRENLVTPVNSTSPCLLSFSIIYLKNSQLKIEFHSIQSLPSNIQLQQLTIKVKLIPDGKEKSIQIRKFIQNETIFDDGENDFFILFSNIQSEKLHEKCLSMTIHGKDQAKKNIHLGHIGKINFNQINQFDNENPIDFIHEIEKIKPVNTC
jgi:hypothetical protein